MTTAHARLMKSLRAANWYERTRLLAVIAADHGSEFAQALANQVETEQAAAKQVRKTRSEVAAKTRARFKARWAPP